MNRMLAGTALAAVLGLGMGTGDWQPPAGERPSRPAGDRPAERRGAELPQDREALKAFVRRRLDDLRRRQETFGQALKRLEEGADPEEIRKDLEGQGGGRRGGGAGERASERAGDSDEGGPPAKDVTPLTPERRENLLKFLDEIAPKMGARIRQTVAKNPESADRVIGRMRAKLDDLRDLRERNPELFQLKVAEMQGAYAVMDGSRRLRDAVRSKAAPEEIRRLRQELKGAMGEHFDQQLAVQQQEVKRLTARLEKLQAEVKERQEGRERFIERQIDDAVKRSENPGPGGQGDRGRNREKQD